MLTKENIADIISTIKNKINPSQIYLFGSYAADKATEASDLDLLVVDDSDQNKNVLALEISKTLFPRNYGLDLIVVSPEEIQRRKQQKLGFWLNILEESRKVYERN